jgi:hypothetical protein
MPSSPPLPSTPSASTPPEATSVPTSASAVSSAAVEPAALELEVSLRAWPSNRLRPADGRIFTLHFTLRNTGDRTVDPSLSASKLLIDGTPWSDWPLTIGNGPRDERWTALPAGEVLVPVPRTAS